MVDLNSVALPAIARLRNTFPGVTIDFRPAPDPVRVHVPATDIQHLLALLAADCVRSMAGRGTLSVAITRTVVSDRFAALCLGVPTGEYIVLSLTDTGAGLESAHSGLESAHRLAERSEGTLSIHRTTGIGSVVRAFFPAAEPASVEHEPESETAAGGTETVLLVEDEPVVRDYLAGILTEYGYRVLTASNRPEAIEAASGYPARIDLLITDMALPGGASGAEIASFIGKTRPEIQVLRISGHAERLGGQPTDILEKPFRPAVLLQRIRMLLNDRRNPPLQPCAADPGAAGPAKE